MRAVFILVTRLAIKSRDDFPCLAMIAGMINIRIFYDDLILGIIQSSLVKHQLTDYTSCKLTTIESKPDNIFSELSVDCISLTYIQQL